KNSIVTLPVFARGFAAQDFEQSTGMGFDKWLTSLDDAIFKLAAIKSLKGEEVEGLVENLKKLTQYMERYARYLESLPDKARMGAAFVGEEVVRGALEAARYAVRVRELKSSIEELLPRITG
ncbi:MAG: hypothetical protein QW760_01090, partial [Thermofilaceae archaeon]